MMFTALTENTAMPPTSIGMSCGCVCAHVATFVLCVVVVGWWGGGGGGVGGGCLCEHIRQLSVSLLKVLNRLILPHLHVLHGCCFICSIATCARCVAPIHAHIDFQDSTDFFALVTASCWGCLLFLFLFPPHSLETRQLLGMFWRAGVLCLSQYGCVSACCQPPCIPDLVVGPRLALTLMRVGTTFAER